MHAVVKKRSALTKHAEVVKEVPKKSTLAQRTRAPTLHLTKPQKKKWRREEKAALDKIAEQAATLAVMQSELEERRKRLAEEAAAVAAAEAPAKKKQKTTKPLSEAKRGDQLTGKVSFLSSYFIYRRAPL